MKTLRKLFYVACTTFFLTSCEETYNDKLFWPGELSQEYGSYIKPSTLDLTYSGEKLIGKTVSFQTEDSKKGTLTLNDKNCQNHQGNLTQHHGGKSNYSPAPKQCHLNHR